MRDVLFFIYSLLSMIYYYTTSTTAVGIIYSVILCYVRLPTLIVDLNGRQNAFHKFQFKLNICLPRPRIKP